MNKPPIKLTSEETKIVSEKLLRGVVSRASTLSFIFAAAFSIYSFTSLEFLRGFQPSLTLWQNTWPRLLLNALPLSVMGYYFRDYNKNAHFKAWVWILSLPVVFFAACMIHVWPIIWVGHPEIYFFVHSANVFILTTALIVVAPPPKFILAQSAGFVFLVAAPVAFLFLRLGSYKMLKFELGDLLIVMPTSAYVAFLIFKLRYKIAIFDLELRKSAAPFLGSTLTDAIYDQKMELLKSRQSDAIVVQMDIRGFTKFYRGSDPAIVKKFMHAYHSIVVRTVGNFGGYWHKSIGDAHILTFGAMSAEEDLNDIPGVEAEIGAAANRKKRHHLESALAAMYAVTDEFEVLKELYDVDAEVGIGIGIASGEIEIRVQGDEFRKELDIDGGAVIRAARLEEYSKQIRRQMAPESSVIILGPELSADPTNFGEFHIWQTDTEETQVRNFPEIKTVWYKILKTSTTNKKRLRGAA